MTTARLRMTMRCTVTRNYTVTTDPFGHSAAPRDWQDHIPSLPCWFWSRAKTEVTDGKEASVEEIGLLVPAGTDVTESDRIVDVTDRRAASIHAGTMEVLSVQRRTGHLELRLREIQ